MQIEVVCDELLVFTLSAGHALALVRWENQALVNTADRAPRAGDRTDKTPVIISGY